MPDNLQLNVGTGGALAATKEVTHGGDTAELQAVSIMGVSGAEGSYVIADINGSAANGLEVDVTRVQGTVTVDGSAVIQPVHDANLISTNNSTTTPLANDATFVGTGDDVSQYAAISVILNASHDSAVDGMRFEFSPDNINWDETHFFTFTVAEGSRHFQFPAAAQYFRVNYINGGTTQTTFRVQTILHVQNINTSIHRLVDAVDPDRSATLVKSILLAQGAGAGDFIPVQATAAGNFKVGIEEVNGTIAGGGVEATALRVTIANDSTGLLSVNNGGTFAVQADSIIPGVGATNLGKAEDAVHASGDTGVMALGVRTDTPVSTVADGDYAPFLMSEEGALWTENLPSEVEAGNSSTATLGIGAAFTGTGISLLDHQAITVIADASHDSAIDGMQFQFSSDNVNWDVSLDFTYTATEGGRIFQLGVYAQYFRVVFTNGGTGQTHFRLQTLLHHETTLTTIHRLVDNASPDRSAEITKSVIIAQAAGAGNFVPVQATAAGNLKTSMEEINGVAPSLNTGIRDAGTQRVTVATDDLVPISAASLPLPTGAATSANQLPDGHNVTVDNAAGSPAQVEIGDGTDQVSVTALADDFANPTALEVGAFMMGWDTTTWDRIRTTGVTSDAKAADGSGDIATVSFNLAFNGATWDRIRGDITNGLDVDVTRTPADGTDGAAHGASQVGFRAMGSDGTNDQQIQTNSAGRLNVQATGNIDHDTADSDKPVKIGGFASVALRTAVDESDRTDASFDLQGQQRTISGVTTSGGTTFYKNLDIDNTEDAVKASAGQVYWIHCINLGTAVRYLKFYDATVASVIVGTTVPDLTFPIPTQGDSNGAGFTLTIPNGIEFGTAITVAATTGFADNDAGDPGANEVILNLGFA